MSQTLAAAAYVLGTLVCLASALLLARGYHRSRQRLLLWSSLCFWGLAASNLLIFVDLVLLPNVDLYAWRLLTTALAMCVLVFGLIWDVD
ncbi:MAG TPA: DUF5985 family protein [Terriglobales bacterium]|nr:DUF5985 family protein [Terriglobales bacterium]